MEIRFVEPAEVEQLRRNVQTAFPSKTPQALLDNMPEELVRPEEGRYLGCFDDDGTMIGSLLMMDFEMNVRGKMMKMGAPAYVSTNFLHKKEHIARNLLRVQMGVFAQTGTAVGALHPFNPAFYRKMGYGYCTEQVMYSPMEINPVYLMQDRRMRKKYWSSTGNMPEKHMERRSILLWISIGSLMNHMW